MRIGVIGCGFTGDFYALGTKHYPNLEMVGATDRDEERARIFCSFHSTKHFPTLESMLADSSIEMMVNLTNSRSHYEVTKACLEAGKHVYSEKPMAFELPQAQELVELAQAKGLYLSTAPCSLLGESCQTLWRALRKDEIGKVRLVYAELDDGPLHLGDPQTWYSPSGARYDYQEEFAAGVTVEHSGYCLGWLAAFFGPAKTITSFASVLWPERPITPEETLNITVPDFSSACITFESGVVARLTCSLIAPFNHVMKFMGDKGVLSVDETWNFSANVFLDRFDKLRYRIERYPIARRYPVLTQLADFRPRTYPPVSKSSLKKRNLRYRMDYARGIAELAKAITQKRAPRLPADYCLHVNELSLAIQRPCNGTYHVKTTFKPLEPLDDAAIKETMIDW